MNFRDLEKAVNDYFNKTFKDTGRDITITSSECNKSFVVRVTYADNTYKYFLQVVPGEQLLDIYELKTTTYVYRGTLIESEVISGHTNILEVVGDGHGGLEIRQADYTYVFRSKRIEFKN